MDIFVIDAENHRLTLRGKPGESLMRVATRNGVSGIDAECGGSCACATCHVVIDDSWFARVGMPSEVEDAILEMVPDRQPTSRLSCQLRLTALHDGLSIRVPARN